MRRIALLFVGALAGCHSAPPSPPSSYQEQIVISPPAHSETRQAAAIHRKELSLRDRALIESAERSLDRVRQRLDWLNGRN